MEIKTYMCYDDKRVVNKTLNDYATYNGDIRENTDLLNPVITMEITFYPDMAPNYVYIPLFRRYYFITGIEFVAGNKMVRVSLHVDVLMTYKTKISEGRGIVTKTEKNLPGLPNNSITVENKTYIMTDSFESNFFNNTGNGRYVITVLG